MRVRTNVSGYKVQNRKQRNQAAVRTSRRRGRKGERSGVRCEAAKERASAASERRGRRAANGATNDVERARRRSEYPLRSVGFERRSRAERQRQRGGPTADNIRTDVERSGSQCAEGSLA